MESWFHVTEQAFTSFRECDAFGRKEIADSSFLLRDKFCGSKCSILCDLSYQALDYGTAQRLSYAALSTLYVAVSQELNFLAGLHESHSGQDGKAAADRFKATIGECAHKFGEVSPTESKALMKFLAERVLGASLLYQFVLQQLPEEVEMEVKMEISTPAHLVPLSEHLPQQSHPE